jgi:outer membrane receptor protein involved in Fe transport
MPATLGLLAVIVLCPEGPASAPLPTIASQDVRGVVQTSDGSPIVGAVVTLVDVDPRASMRAATRESRETTTDATGAFTLADGTLPVRLQVTARGFAPGLVTVTATPVTIVLVPAALTESVIVTADRLPAWRDPTAGATVFGAVDLERIPALTLDEALRSVSGFSLFRRSPARAGNPTTHGVTMRGLSASGASRGLVLLDGVPLNDGFGGWVTWTRLPSGAIARVDLERGGSSDTYGSDALGGVLRISTPVTRRRDATFGRVRPSR